MVFDELLPKVDVEDKTVFMEPTRTNLDPLLGQNKRQTGVTILIYLTQILVSYIFLVLILGIEDTYLLYFYSAFIIGIGAFVDQIFNPDENSKTGYYILIAMYYAVYKFVIFGFGVYFIFALLGKTYEIHYLEETLPFLTIFVSWALGQKIGFFYEHRKLKEKAKNGFILTDIDKLKIFLYQVHRRSFLKMIIQKKQAKFSIQPSFRDIVTNADYQRDTRLVYLSMANFLKYLKIKILPVDQYVIFSQIKEIDFSKNKIKEFSTAIFKIFPNVDLVDLSYNKIKSISSEHMEKLLMSTGTVVVNFDNNPLFTSN